MNTGTALSGHVGLLWCARCRHRLRPVIPDGVTRGYDCTTGCRTRPIDALWLDAQASRAVAGRISLDAAAQVIDAITVAEATPAGVRVRWRAVFPLRPQPVSTTRPSTVFVRVPRQRPEPSAVVAGQEPSPPGIESGR